jgi:ABC-type lipoprotein export system ATPase subunit
VKSPALFLDRVTVYGEQGLPLLMRVHLRVEEGEAVALLGRSGCGKTSLLRVMAGVLHPRTGIVMLGDVNLRDASYAARQAAQAAVGFVPDRGGVWNNRSVRGNISLPLEYHGVGNVDARVQAIAEELDLAQDLALAPGQVSGSSQRRMLYARALVSSPRWLLVDQPQDLMGPEDAALVAAAIERRRSTSELAVVYADQPRDLAPFVVDRSLRIEAGQVIG